MNEDVEESVGAGISSNRSFDASGSTDRAPF